MKTAYLRLRFVYKKLFQLLCKQLSRENTRAKIHFTDEPELQPQNQCDLQKILGFLKTCGEFFKLVWCVLKTNYEVETFIMKVKAFVHKRN